MKYLLIMMQENGCCAEQIGCGILYQKLKATSIEGARIEAYKMHKALSVGTGKFNLVESKIITIESEEDIINYEKLITVEVLEEKDEINRNKKQKAEAREKLERRAHYEILRKEFGDE